MRDVFVSGYSHNGVEIPQPSSGGGGAGFNPNIYNQFLGNQIREGNTIVEAPLGPQQGGPPKEGQASLPLRGARASKVLQVGQRFARVPFMSEQLISTKEEEGAARA